MNAPPGLADVVAGYAGFSTRLLPEWEKQQRVRIRNYDLAEKKRKKEAARARKVVDGLIEGARNAANHLTPSRPADAYESDSSDPDEEPSLDYADRDKAVLVVRTKSALTFAMDYPFRHVQV
jgi:hypothetical protein